MHAMHVTRQRVQQQNPGNKKEKQNREIITQMSFSGAVKLDLSDFIAPSQACVVTSLDGNKLQLADDQNVQGGTVQLHRVAPTAAPPRPPGGNAGFAQTREEAGSGAVKVTLQDCLACSGCVTSAETVLLEHQSIAELRSRLQDPAATVIVSVSPQSRASLAARHGLTPSQAQRKLAALFRGLGAAHVLDLGLARDMALLEAAAEFVARYRARADAAQRLAADDGARTVDTGDGQPAATDAAPAGPVLPMLASACPGWVCYAEKTQGAWVLPHISSAKSPQAVQGSLVKQWLAPRLGRKPSAVYHCAVMPCFDKKLEASREDFQLPGTALAEVDSVLATTEVQQLLDEEGLSLAQLPEADHEEVTAAGLAGDEGRDGGVSGYPGGAGGYLEFIYRYAAKELFGVEVPPGPLPLRPVRNADFKEVVLDVDGAPALRFASAYGFRNIQTLMRQMKRRRCAYDYVEVMACPSGCLNGGGQLPAQKDQSATAWQAQVEQAYHHPTVQLRPPQDDPLVGAMYKDWVQDQSKSVLHTAYHAREKPISVQVSDW